MRFVKINSSLNSDDFSILDDNEVSVYTTSFLDSFKKDSELLKTSSFQAFLDHILYASRTTYLESQMLKRTGSFAINNVPIDSINENVQSIFKKMDIDSIALAIKNNEDLILAKLGETISINIHFAPPSLDRVFYESPYDISELHSDVEIFELSHELPSFVLKADKVAQVFQNRKEWQLEEHDLYGLLKDNLTLMYDGFMCIPNDNIEDFFTFRRAMKNFIDRISCAFFLIREYVINEHRYINYDNEKKLCTIVENFYQAGFSLIDDEDHPFVKQFEDHDNIKNFFLENSIETEYLNIRIKLQKVDFDGFIEYVECDETRYDSEEKEHYLKTFKYNEKYWREYFAKHECLNGSQSIIVSFTIEAYKLDEK
jgi:hypothetical protein